MDDENLPGATNLWNFSSESHRNAQLKVEACMLFLIHYIEYANLIIKVHFDVIVHKLSEREESWNVESFEMAFPFSLWNFSGDILIILVTIIWKRWWIYISP